MRNLVLALALFAGSPALAQGIRVQLPIGVRVEVAPPQLRVEVAPPAPAPTQVWVPGYWSYANGAYVWIAGAYAVPPQPTSRWVAPRWALREGGWYFEPGRWEVAPAGYPPPQVPPAPPQQAYPPPPRQAPPRRLSRDEAVQRAYDVTARHGLRALGVKDVEEDDGLWKVKVLVDGGVAKVLVDPVSGNEVRFEGPRGCKPNQYWDGEKCRHKGKGHGARKHDDEDD
ncbi:MAG TPA: hypothetical protein VLT47_05065 [Anaeromyxobacteraceae bacterium]|nr:hypothetical protein [Anaeromyxobacteraceae bacterium]